MDAAKLLRNRRQFHQLDQAGLARLAGTSQGQISRIERGAISPTVKTLGKILEAMGDDLVLIAQAKPLKTTDQKPDEEIHDADGSSLSARPISPDNGDSIFYGDNID